MSKKLIVNADDFGFTFGNNRGILECLKAGVVRSVSVGVNFPAVEETPELIEKYPHVSVGIHLDLSVGPCVSDPKDVPDLVNEAGEFLGSQFRVKAMHGKIPHEQMVRELTAQVERFLGHGVDITHWDSHQNQHLYPPFFEAAIEVARRFGIERMRTHDHHIFVMGRCRRLRAGWHLLTHPRRALVYAASKHLMRKARKQGMRMADRLISPGLVDSAHKQQRVFWVRLFQRLPDGISEVCCHPCYPDQTLGKNDARARQKHQELEILRDPELTKEAARYGVELISFREI